MCTPHAAAIMDADLLYCEFAQRSGIIPVKCVSKTGLFDENVVSQALYQIFAV